MARPGQAPTSAGCDLSASGPPGWRRHGAGLAARVGGGAAGAAAEGHPGGVLTLFPSKGLFLAPCSGCKKEINSEMEENKRLWFVSSSSGSLRSS